MAKLLAWGDALFFVSCEHEKLRIQRIVVYAEEKKTSLCLCSIKYDEAFALPADTHLVAAKEVEDTELAIRYPLLVFRTAGRNGQDLPLDSLSVGRKRHRFTRVNTNGLVDDASSGERDCLLFCVLYATDSEDMIGLRFLNKLEFWTCDDDAYGDDIDAISDKYCSSLQCFLTDGPCVLLFQRDPQTAIVLRLQRGTQGDDCRFYTWLKQVNVAFDLKDIPSESFEVAACAYVSATHCSTPHLLIHVQRNTKLSSDDRQCHFWSILKMDSLNNEIVQCDYLATECSGVTLKFDQITCCCFISEINEWDFTASTSSETAPWDTRQSSQSSRSGINLSTFVVTGTTSNTIYVHSDKILLVSYILPARPVDIFLWDNDASSQYHVLCVRCDNAERSFFMLGFSSNIQNVSMDLLLSFNHVGHAYAGNFAERYTGNSSAFCQVLLLNHISTISDTSSSSIKIEVDYSADDEQLVKRSVLVTQKVSGSGTKLSCHRLRLDENKLKHGSLPRKRSRNKKSSCKGDPRIEPEHPRYIERTQKASSRDESVIQDDKETYFMANTYASQSQLDKLQNSLLGRLEYGVHDLERLLLIGGDKDVLTRQLILLTAQQWRTIFCKKEAILLVPCNLLSNANTLIEMKTIVGAPLCSNTISKNNNETRALQDVKVQVMLQQFRVLGYSPASSLLYSEVLLKNLSGSKLDECFVVLTARNGAAAQSWTCSSTVFSEFSSGKDTADHLAGYARFQTELHFAPKFPFLRQRKPLELMIWLHWGTPRSDYVSKAGLDWQPNASEIAVASVQIYPDDVLVAGGKSCNAWDHESSSKGTNLVPWFANFKSPTCINSIIRPTFSIVDLPVMSTGLILFEISRMIAKLPSDVYVMCSPLRISHFRSLQCLLRFLRQELLLSPTGHFTLSNRTRKFRQEDCASIPRSIQQKTDLQANQILHGLQRRVNFHTMWFDATAVGTARQHKHDIKGR